MLEYPAQGVPARFSHACMQAGYFACRAVAVASRVSESIRTRRYGEVATSYDLLLYRDLGTLGALLPGLQPLLEEAWGLAEELKEAVAAGDQDRIKLLAWADRVTGKVKDALDGAEAICARGEGP